MLESDIDKMEEGDKLDELVGRLVFGSVYEHDFMENGVGDCSRCSAHKNDHSMRITDGGEKCTVPPEYSWEWKYAGEVMDRLEELATRFQTADGFTHLDCGHYADHGMCVTRKSTDDSAELDAEPWSYHIHLGIVGENDVTPKHWGSGEEFFCARGATGPECISKAAIKAFDPEFIRGQVEPEDKEITQFIGERFRQITKG